MVLDEASYAQLRQARQNGTEAAVLAALQQSGQIPTTVQIQSGSFSINNGVLVTPLSGNPDPIEGRITPLDVVVADDQIVQGSICAGFDCVNNENFSFDTIRLKENNLRIGVDDTSTTGFPANDWELTFNDSASGGANYFALRDVTAGRNLMMLIAGAPANSLYMSNSGNIGFGTSTPILELHVLDNDTPALRLEQDSSGGFTAQTWDIGANEANFFIRDVTSGSRLSFRIVPGAPTNSLVINSVGNIGLGTFSPSAKLHVVGNVLVEGNLTEFSDRNAKENFALVDVQAVLEQAAQIPIYTWNYKMDAAEIRHMGPTAQDFYASFALGADDRHLAPLDVNGVLLASNQALYAQLKAQASEIAALQAQNAALAAQIAAIEARLNQLDAQP